MLACARLGAIHSVVFGGFSPDSLAGRIEDVGESFVTLEIAPDVRIKLQKTAISMVLPKGSLKSA